MTTWAKLGQDVIFRVAEQVVEHGDRRELDAMYEMMKMVSEACYVRGDLESARNAAQANESFAIAVKDAVIALRANKIERPRIEA